MNKTVLTDQVVFLGISGDVPPRLLFRKTATRADGARKEYSEAVPILDAHLLTRLQTELAPQDGIELSVAYDYASPGCPSQVTDFCKIASREPVSA